MNDHDHSRFLATVALSAACMHDLALQTERDGDPAAAAKLDAIADGWDRLAELPVGEI